MDEVCILGIEDKNLDSRVSLYPNPSTTHVIISTLEAEIKELAVKDIQGREIFRHTPHASMAQIDLLGVRPGNYLVMFTLSNGKTGVKTLIVH